LAAASAAFVRSQEFMGGKTLYFPNSSDKGWSIPLDGAEKTRRAYM
jgi:hypothetical protein